MGFSDQIWQVAKHEQRTKRERLVEEREQELARGQERGLGKRAQTDRKLTKILWPPLKAPTSRRQ